MQNSPSPNRRGTDLNFSSSLGEVHGTHVNQRSEEVTEEAGEQFLLGESSAHLPCHKGFRANKCREGSHKEAIITIKLLEFVDQPLVI